MSDSAYRCRQTSTCANRLAITLLAAAIPATAAPPATRGPLPETALLSANADRSTAMVAGIDRWLDRATEDSIQQRARLWKRDLSSPQAYLRSVAANRRRFAQRIGLVDQRQPAGELISATTLGAPNPVAVADRFEVHAVRWGVLPGVEGEGLLLVPRGPVAARLVALPDADETPEMLAGLAPGLEPQAQFARRLAEAGCQVLVPTLVDRSTAQSGNPRIAMTNQTHREWIYRQAYEMGRHVVGYEVQKVLSAVDWFTAQNQLAGSSVKRNGHAGGQSSPEQPPIGVAGYGEGGLVALYAAAVDTRIDAALVSGYFDSRQQMANEPIYRNVFGMLAEFGDAELASLVAPRALIIEASRGPQVAGPPSPPAGSRESAAPGTIQPPLWTAVQAEFARAQTLLRPSTQQAITLPKGGAKMDSLQLIAPKHAEPGPSGSAPALQALLAALKCDDVLAPLGKPPVDSRATFDPAVRQQRQVKQLVDYTQGLLQSAERIRADDWQRAWPSGPGPWRASQYDPAAWNDDEWKSVQRRQRERYWNEVIGRLPDPPLPARPRTRVFREDERWTGYEVQLDVWPDVFAWGYLLVPKDIKPGQRRAVVVCQHGLEGLPSSVVTRDKNDRSFRAYRAYAARLADRGFVVYAPHNPYRGKTRFRQLQRKANPLGLTLFSFILGQHQRTLEWLSSLEFVDPQRIGFYGLSYGGTSAMRIPALLDGYALSICSACFNDWTRKIMSLDFRSAYMFTAEYEQFMFNQGATFNHAEMAWLIAPRPFMVERGHRDGVAPDEWVAHEYAKVRRHYARLGLADRTRIEFFDGGHVIHGQGTFEFLHKHLQHPLPKAASNPSRQ